MTTDEPTLRQLVEIAVEAYDANGVPSADHRGYVTITLPELWFVQANRLLDNLEAAEATRKAILGIMRSV